MPEQVGPSPAQVRPFPEDHGSRWTEEAEAGVLALFDAGMSPKEIALKSGRSASAIRKRLQKHGRLPSPSSGSLAPDATG